MAEPSFDVQAEASLFIPASRKAVWKAIIDLSRRPSLKAWTPRSGTWPEETARVHTIMDKVAADMPRTETVVRMALEERLILKIEPDGSDMLAWLDHRLVDAENGCLITLGVTVNWPEPPVPIDRDEYVASTTSALADALRIYAANL